MKAINRFAFLIVFLLTGCPPYHNSKNTLTPVCEIVPPTSWGASVDNKKTREVQAELAKVGRTQDITQSEFRHTANQTYQTLGDKDVACAMLLKTLTCLSQNGAPASTLGEFQHWLSENKSCAPGDEAVISIDSLVPLKQAQWGQRRSSLVLDLFVRNSGDKPAILSEVTLRFDEKSRPSRAPADMLKVSGVYVVTVGRETATAHVDQNFNGQAAAWYPGPGVNTLIISTPVAQSLNARSVDRFRLQIDFLEEAKIRGPMRTVRAEIKYNDNQTVASDTVNLVH
ncbi:hypothetical protein [Vagococcus sp. WN89Y]|uniref:hypothetical protein n=1 Tax=Vagococcus sp. WN89Y TaxID=3457258 RepID=UPI003FCC9424